MRGMMMSEWFSFNERRWARLREWLKIALAKAWNLFTTLIIMSQIVMAFIVKERIDEVAFLVRALLVALLADITDRVINNTRDAEKRLAELKALRDGLQRDLEALQVLNAVVRERDRIRENARRGIGDS